MRIPSLEPQTFHKLLLNHPRGSVTQSMIFAAFHKTDWALCLHIGPIHKVIRYPQQMVQMGFCDL